jgi:PAS domain S-box-containing protein
MKYQPSYILNLRTISTVIGFVVASLLVFHTMSASTKFTYAQCQSNVKVVAQHLERVTQQSSRVVKGVAAWLAANPRANFSSDTSLLSLSPVLNMDPEDSHAIAVIEENGHAWLLDEKYAGRSFDVSERPYFENMRLMEVGKLGYGSRSNNINTGHDTISVNYKAMFNSKPIVISTAFSVTRVELFFNTIVNNSNLSLHLYNNDHLEIFASINGNNVSLARQSKPKPTEHNNDEILPTLATISCSQNVPDSKFIVVATADPYETFRQSIPLILVIVTLTLLAATTNFLSHRRINGLVSKYRRNIENTPLGCISWDKDFRCVEWNKSAETIFGYTADEAISCHAAEIVVPSEIKDEINNIYRSLLEQKGGTRNTNENRTKDGRTIICDWYNTPISDENGQVTGVYSLVQDITEPKRMEKNLNSALVDAERANQSKSEFLASMSHELRTPLNAILGFSDILENQYFGPPGAGRYREYAADIHHSGEHLLELINDILDISSIEAGKTSLHKETLIIKAIIDDCNHIVSEKALSKGIHLEAIVSNDLLPLYADKRAVKQILLNLLTNSIKFTQNDGKITVTVYSVDSGIRIEVVDNGSGIPSDKLKEVTAPFSKGFNNPHLAEQGWGLGLAITKSLVELHGGVMTIASEVGNGTTVAIEIPSHTSNTN